MSSYGPGFTASKMSGDFGSCAPSNWRHLVSPPYGEVATERGASLMNKTSKEAVLWTPVAAWPSLPHGEGRARVIAFNAPR